MNYRLPFKEHTSKVLSSQVHIFTRHAGQGKGTGREQWRPSTTPRAATRSPHVTVGSPCRADTTAAPPRKWPPPAPTWFSCAASTRSSRAGDASLWHVVTTTACVPRKAQRLPKTAARAQAAPPRLHSTVAPSGSATTPAPWPELASRPLPADGTRRSGSGIWAFSFRRLLPDSQLTTWEKPEQPPEKPPPPQPASRPSFEHPTATPRGRRLGQAALKGTRDERSLRVKPEPQGSLLRAQQRIRETRSVLLSSAPQQPSVSAQQASETPKRLASGASEAELRNTPGKPKL